MKKPTMDQKWRQLRSILIKQDFKEAEELGLPARFTVWMPYGGGPKEVEGYAVACMFGPLGGHNIIVRCSSGIYKIQHNRIKYLRSKDEHSRSVQANQG